MNITTTNVNVAGGAAAAADGDTAVQAENTAAADLDSIRLAINKTFHIVDDKLNAIAQALMAEVEKKNITIQKLTELLNGLDQWNTPPGVQKVPADPTDPVYQDRINKTDTLLLNNISIPDETYDCAKYLYGKPGGEQFTGYTNMQIKELAKVPPDQYTDEQLYWKPTPGVPDEKTLFRWVAKDNSLEPVSSVETPKTKKHDADFSAFQPGDLVQDDQTKKYYRVTNDKNGMEVTGYPLQKFIYNATADTLFKLKNAVGNQLATIRDLSKSDSVKTQRLSGDINLMSTMFPALASAITEALQAVLRRISS